MYHSTTKNNTNLPHCTEFLQSIKLSSENTTVEIINGCYELKLVQL